MLRRSSWALALCLVGIFLRLEAQSIFATLTGVVSDTTGAVVPKADVTLRNESSGDIRRTVTNNDGYYTFTSFPTGTYTVTVEIAGFEKSQVTGIAFTGAEKRNLDVSLKVGNASTQVEVVSQAEALTPVDSGEKSTTLTTKELQNYTQVGRSAAEYIKILPGFVFTNGLTNKPGFTGESIGINGNGDGGSQSAFNSYQANGLPGGVLEITADGSHVSDPGCNCATPVNPNPELIQEIKVLTANFAAENSKGPVVVNFITKAGGRDFHGGAYLYARDGSLNANDALNQQSGIPRPASRYLFPGANIGGPVIIPGTNFNKNRDKLFFFAGFEYYKQTLDTGVVRATVPTANMRNGNFSAAEINSLGTVDASGGPPAQLTSAALAKYPGGIIPQADPNGAAFLKLYPLPNANPNSTGGYNYVNDIVFDQNSWQFATRVDYSISDNTKLFVRYNLQKETQLFPVGLWWRNGNQVPYPTPISAPNESQSVSTSLTHVFNPTLTNEFVFGYTYINFPNTFQDPKKVDRTALGATFTGVYKNGVTQIPAFTGWGGSEFATIFNPGGFEASKSEGLYAKKWLPSFSDTITKVLATHTIRGGFYYENVRNSQPANNYTNGLITEPANSGPMGIGTGNPYADLYTGVIGSYQEQSKNPPHDEAYNLPEFFVQDSWKATRRLTLDFGLRFSYFGQWYDRSGNGFAVWNPALYNPNDTTPTDYTGFTWAKRDSKVPTSGFTSPSLAVAPRFGLAYDLFGTGKTIVRGGWGRFYFHSAQSTNGLDASAGVLSTNQSNVTFAQLQASQGQLGAVGISALTLNDNRVQYDDSYSFTISQRLPWSSIFEAAYVGNSGHRLILTGGQFANVNPVPAGALFKAGTDPNNLQNVDSYRPYNLYGDITVNNHNGYSNYNSLQLSLARQRSNYTFQFNYTFAKALGLIGNDPFNLRNDYGPLDTDRRHVLNMVYSILLPINYQGSKVLQQVVNGWQISGITQLQSGANLAANIDTTNHTYPVNPNALLLSNGYAASNLTVTGTSALRLNPIVTCDPNANLGPHQFVNGNCFAVPTQQGQNGPTVLPESFGPWYFNSDLSIFKNFQMKEQQRLQFRVSAFNFLNHPLYSFLSGSPALNLNYCGPTNLTNTGCKLGSLITNNFGTASDRVGHRIVELAVKYYF